MADVPPTSSALDWSSLGLILFTLCIGGVAVLWYCNKLPFPLQPMIDCIRHRTDRGHLKSEDEQIFNDKFVLEFSRKITTDWKHLALYLGFRDPQIEEFEANNRSSVVEQCRKMLACWYKQQTNNQRARQKLTGALKEMGRMDVVLEILGEKCDQEAKDAADKCEKMLKDRYGLTGSFVQMHPLMPQDMKPIKDIYTDLHMETVDDTASKFRRRYNTFMNAYGNTDSDWMQIAEAPCKGTRSTLKSYEEVFLNRTKENRLIKQIICQGLAGVGKSTLIDKIAYDWAFDLTPALKQFKLVFVLKMCALEQHSDLIDAVFNQLIDGDAGINRIALRTFITENPGEVIILLDGFDELVTTTLDETKFGSILRILNRKEGRECWVIVTTRPSKFERLVSKSLVEMPFTNVTILGFSDENKKKYVHRFFSGKQDMARSLLDKIQSSNTLFDLAKSPMLLLMMCLLWRVYSVLPATTSCLYSKALKYIFKRKVDKDAPTADIDKLVIALGETALSGLFSPDQRLSFSEREFDKSVLDKAIKVGILTSQVVLKGLDTHNSIQFIHKTFQEFCAAKYFQTLQKSNPEKLQRVLDEIVDPCYFEMFLRFSCDGSVECTKHILLKLQDKCQEKDEILKLALLCHFESQTAETLSQNFIDYVLCDEISFSDFSSDHVYSLCYFLKCVTKRVDRRANSLSKVHTFALRLSNFQIWLKDLLFYCKEMTLSSLLFTQHPTTLSHLSVGISTDVSPSHEVWFNLRKLKHLKQLTLVYCALTGEDLKWIANAISTMPHLVKLDLSENRTLSGSFFHLKEMHHLQELSLTRCEVTGKDVVHIAQSMPNLVELDLGWNETLGGSFSLLNEMQHLQKLSLWLCALIGKDIEYIAQSMPNVVELDLHGNKTLSGSISGLKEMQHLQKVTLEDCALTGKDMEHIAQSMPNLVELNLANNKTLGGSFPLLKEMYHLQKLKLWSCALTGKDVEHVAQSMPNLVVLDLGDNETLSGLDTLASHVKRLKRLKMLDLRMCSLTEDVKRELAALQVDLQTAYIGGASNATHSGYTAYSSFSLPITLVPVGHVAPCLTEFKRVEISAIHQFVKSRSIAQEIVSIDV